MTVSELIDKLKECPQDIEVITLDCEYGLPLEINTIEISTRRTDEFRKDYAILDYDYKLLKE